ncbi:uncharacterized protein LOC115632841 [Scaptodrosophila lebanonensis]|uniref:Uncharacterized protein LOC115632841 n=1 Tax=Drosophila lebanonensis TaxID=7225 RepID=A0A6J2UEW8_DROLE|nr:uncharacterized protein LOC115632841 [Scaptodrosophila lebanonensis]
MYKLVFVLGLLCVIGQSSATGDLIPKTSLAGLTDLLANLGTIAGEIAGCVVTSLTDCSTLVTDLAGLLNAIPDMVEDCVINIISGCADVVDMGAFSSYYFRKVVVDFNHKYVSHYAVDINPDHTSLNIALSVIRDLNVDMWLRITVSQRGAKNTYKRLFFYDMNLCNVVGKSKDFNIMQLWIQNVFKYGDMPLTCLFRKSNYSWSNLRVDKDSIPPFIMSGRFRIDPFFYLKDWDNEVAFNSSVFVDIKMK